MTTVTTSAVLRAEALGWSVDEKTILSGVSVDAVSYTHLTLPTIYSV